MDKKQLKTLKKSSLNQMPSLSYSVDCSALCWHWDDYTNAVDAFKAQPGLKAQMSQFKNSTSLAIRWHLEWPPAAFSTGFHLTTVFVIII